MLCYSEQFSLEMLSIHEIFSQVCGSFRAAERDGAVEFKYHFSNTSKMNYMRGQMLKQTGNVLKKLKTDFKSTMKKHV